MKNPRIHPNLFRMEGYITLSEDLIFELEDYSIQIKKRFNDLILARKEKQTEINKTQLEEQKRKLTDRRKERIKKAKEYDRKKKDYESCNK